MATNIELSFSELRRPDLLGGESGSCSEAAGLLPEFFLQFNLRRLYHFYLVPDLLEGS